jgi:hypothetical protein
VRTLIAVSVLSLALLNSSESQTSPALPVQLLIPGDLQTRARPVLGSAPWFGLFHDSLGGYQLRPSTVIIEDTPRGCGGQGRRIATSDSSHPVLLVAGMRSLQRGDVDSAFAGNRFVYPAESVPLKLGDGRLYTLSAFGTATWRPSEVWVSDYQIMLQRGPRRQVLAVFPRVDWDGTPRLLWAGDLDRDQQLDLLLDLRRSYVGNIYVLFLSSLAGADSLVGRAAEFATAGC